MTRVLILGGGGMIGQKLAASLARDGLGDDPAPEVTLFDIAFPDGGAAGARIAGNLTDPAIPAQLAALRADIIYHLAAIVSGEAEANFDLGWQTNMMAFWTLLDALRRERDTSAGQYRPKMVFTSSIAVFGAPFPDRIGDDFLAAPLTSYGAQKSACELMLGDMARKGFIDGIALRLPTICVRPGAPNKAASGFFSGIIREPLNGQDAILPVPPETRHWHASPRSAIGFLRHAAGLDTARLGGRRALNMPGISCTVAEQIEALRDIAGNAAVALIRPAPDPDIIRIVEGWPRDFDPARARDLGFTADTDFRAIIETYIADDMPRT